LSGEQRSIAPGREQDAPVSTSPRPRSCWSRWSAFEPRRRIAAAALIAPETAHRDGTDGAAYDHMIRDLVAFHAASTRRRRRGARASWSPSEIAARRPAHRLRLDPTGAPPVRRTTPGAIRDRALVREAPAAAAQGDAGARAGMVGNSGMSPSPPAYLEELDEFSRRCGAGAPKPSSAAPRTWSARLDKASFARRVDPMSIDTR